MAKPFIPLLNRVLVVKNAPPARSAGGIYLHEKTSKCDIGKVVAVGAGCRNTEGKLIPVSVKEGDTVLLPEYGGTEVERGGTRCHLYRDVDILGILHD